jgi:ribose/xylose/arabinose/galactoside ABC-type transport system permease subunit
VKKGLGVTLLQNNIYVLVAVLFLVPLATMDTFQSAGNMTVLMKNISLWGIMAIGMTLVLLLGVFDMSLGMMVSLITILVVLSAQRWGLGVAAAVAIAAGLSCGALNGIIITKLQINPFITTLGTQVLFKGIALILTAGSPVANTNASLAGLYEVRIVALPFITITLPMVILFASLLAVEYVLRNTKFGHDVYVAGGNPEAARFVGIDTDFMTIACYMGVGLFAGITGLLLASFQGSGNAAFGETFTLQSIAACVLGGVALSGGYGNTIRAVLGVAALQLIIKILYYTASTLVNLQVGIIGIILIGVLFIDKFSKIGRASCRERV